jgi:hypothetical protein
VNDGERIELEVALVVERCAFEVEDSRSGLTSERAERELLDGPVRPGVGLVVKDVNGAVSNLEESICPVIVMLRPK